MKITNIVTILLVAFILVSCAPAAKIVPTETIVSTSTLTPVPFTPTSTETTIPITITPIPLPTTKVERWMEYQNAFAIKMFGASDAICEWEIFGQKKQEVYVWALCQTVNREINSAGSVPAVIHLGNDGSIEVQFPGDGANYGVDIRKMFPLELQEKILAQNANMDEMSSHLELRLKNPVPPLIVLSGVPLP